MNQQRWQRWGLAIAVCGGLLAWAWYAQTRPEMPPSPVAESPAPESPASESPSPNTARFPVADLPDTPFQNATFRGAAGRGTANSGPGEAGYVGSQACIDCHQQEHATYAGTGMGQSLAGLAPSREPPDGEFVHTLSARRFRVYRDGDQLRHREELLAEPSADPSAKPSAFLLADHAVQYVIGSGRHSRSYLCEIDGFLVESPITWYASQRAWSMSPGYDQPIHAGFHREVPEKCLFCHAGRAVAIDDSLHRIRFIEHAIGCERCHGPGSLHVARWETGDAPRENNDGVDHTIVNPAHLSRDLADAICHQCHLTSEAYVPARGRRISDFRPGLPLQHFRHYFQPRDATSSMRVVGHVDQLMLSRCYTASDTLGCMTCHNPHGFPAPEQKTAYYRQKCLQCHQQEACRVAPEVRQARSPENNCLTCHMPKTATDIPHMAFTHHRIGIHAAPSADPPPRSHAISALEPLHDLSFLSATDRARALGLAYAGLGARSADRQSARTYLQRGRQLLLEVEQAGLHDGEVDTALAQLTWPRNPQLASRHATRALGDKMLSPVGRVNAWYAVAANHVQQQHPQQALGVLRQLTRLRRNAADWSMMGDCYFALNDPSRAVDAFERAVEIDPNLLEIHELLTNYYARSGDRRRADRQRALMQAIGKNHAQAGRE